MFFSLRYNMFITNMLTSEKRERYLWQYNSDTGAFSNVGANQFLVVLV